MFLGHLYMVMKVFFDRLDMIMKKDWKRLRKRPMCWLAIGFLLMICIFLVGRSYKEVLYQEDIGNVYLEGRIVDKQYKEFDYGGYWQVTLKQVKVLKDKEKRGVISLKQRSAEEDQEEEQGKRIEDLEGKYLCQISDSANLTLKIGQQILLYGKYTPWEESSNPGQFDSGKYYCSQGILGQFRKCKVIKQGGTYSKFREEMWNLRQQTNEFLQQELGEDDGGLIAAMLLGEKNGLNEEDKNLYQRNGISHILAISGVNTLNLVSLSKSQMPNLRASPQVLLRKFTLFYQQILSGFYPLVVLPLFRGCFSKLTK